MRNKHIFFDLDRTLWDFDLNSERALLQLFEMHEPRFKQSSFDVFHRHYKNVNQELWHRYSKGKIDKESLRYDRFRKSFAKLGIEDEDLVSLFGDGYVSLSPKQTNLVPFTRDVLENLVSSGFTLHIITNGFSEIQEIKLEACGIRTYFENVVCSEAIGINKPNPMIFKYAMDQAGVAPKDALMIGDDYRTDVVGAIRSGMQAIWFQPKPQPKKSKFENQVSCLSEIPWLASKLLRL